MGQNWFDLPIFSWFKEQGWRWGQMSCGLFAILQGVWVVFFCTYDPDMKQSIEMVRPIKLYQSGGRFSAQLLSHEGSLAFFLFVSIRTNCKLSSYHQWFIMCFSGSALWWYRNFHEDLGYVWPQETPGAWETGMFNRISCVLYIFSSLNGIV